MADFWPWVPLVAATHTYLVWRRSLAYLRYFQQEGYDAVRFLRWTNVRSFTDPAFWMSLGAALLFLVDSVLGGVLFTVGAVVLGLVQPHPRHPGKLPLRMTWRA